MNKIVFLLLLICVQLGYSQYNADWEPAEIYLKDGSIKKGQARLTMLDKATPFGQNEKLRFTEGKKKPIEEIKAKNVDSIIFQLSYGPKGNGSKSNKNRSAKFIVINKNDKKTKLGFAELIIDGKVKLLSRTVSSGNSMNISILNESLLMRDDDVPVEFNYAEIKSFKKRAMDYFYDCPGLINKLEDKTYKSDDLEAIVKYYNDNCAK
jgi:hypothetical protein